MNSNKKRVLFVVSNLLIGGVEKVCYEIIRHIDLTRFQFDFLVSVDPAVQQYYDPIMQAYGCCVYKGGLITDSDSKKRFLEFERKLLQEKRYDIVHSHVDFLNAWVLKTAKESGVKKRISHVHLTLPDKAKANILEKCKYKLQQFFLNYYSTIRLGCTKQACIDFYGCRANYSVIYNGFEVDRLLNLPPRKIQTV